MLNLTDYLNALCFKVVEKSGKRKSGTVYVAAGDLHRGIFGHMENFKSEGLNNIRKGNAVKGLAELSLFFKLELEIRIRPVCAVVRAFK